MRRWLNDVIIIFGCSLTKATVKPAMVLELRTCGLLARCLTDSATNATLSNQLALEAKSIRRLARNPQVLGSRLEFQH